MGTTSSDVKVLSAGAIEPGLIAAAEAFGKESGSHVAIEWATTPTIRQLVASGSVADILVVPPDAVDHFAAAGKIADGQSVYLGRVGVGIAVRDGAPEPAIDSAETLKQALLDAESVVFNRASSGLYVEQLLGRMGVADAIQAKAVRYSNGPEMLQHLIDGKGREFGFCAIIEILMYCNKGLRLVGPLPESIQRYTTYMAVPMTVGANLRGAREFLLYLGSPDARRIFASYGIE